MPAHRSTQSLGQAADVMGMRGSPLNGGGDGASPGTSPSAAQLQQRARLHHTTSSNLVPLASGAGVLLGRQLSSGVMGNGNGMRAASPNDSSASFSYQSNSSQHSRVASSQSSVMSGFSSRQNAGDSSFGSADTSMDSYSIGGPSSTASRAASTTESGSSQMKRNKTKIEDLDRKRICEYAMAHPRQKQIDIAAVFDVERSTVSKILKNKEKWLSLDVGDVYLNRDRTIRYPDLEKHLLAWTREREMLGHDPTNEELRTQALVIIKANHIAGAEDFVPSDSWMETFRIRKSTQRAPSTSAASTVSGASNSGASQAEANADAALARQTTPSSMSGLGIDFTLPTAPPAYLDAGLMPSAGPATAPAPQSQPPQQTTPRSSSRLAAARNGSSRDSLARSFSDTDLDSSGAMQTPTKRRKGLTGSALSPNTAPNTLSSESISMSPRTSRRRQEALRRQRREEDTPSGDLRLDIRGIESTTPRSQSVARTDVSGVPRSADADSLMQDALDLPDMSRRSQQGSVDRMDMSSPFPGASTEAAHAQPVTAEEARSLLTSSCASFAISPRSSAPENTGWSSVICRGPSPRAPRGLVRSRKKRMLS